MPAHRLAEGEKAVGGSHEVDGEGVEGLERPAMLHRKPAMLLDRLANIDGGVHIDDCKAATINCTGVEIHRRPAIVLIIVKTLNRRRANKGFYYDEGLCMPAINHCIARTLNCRRANKGFYYDESLCRHAKGLVDAAVSLAPGGEGPGRRSAGKGPDGGLS